MASSWDGLCEMDLSKRCLYVSVPVRSEVFVTTYCGYVEENRDYYE
jgi:hypothetical protein